MGIPDQDSRRTIAQSCLSANCRKVTLSKEVTGIAAQQNETPVRVSALAGFGFQGILEAAAETGDNMRVTRIFAAAALVLCSSAGAASAQGYYYGDDCRSENAAAGTVLGAIAGGIGGNRFGRGGGRAAATVGGVFLGGMAGNAIAGDMPCDDRRYAFRVYTDGFTGPVGRRYEWRNPNGDYGYFIPTREYQDGPTVCRDFDESVYRRGRWHERQGSACRQHDGNWHFR
jgi:surface antigen